MKRHEKITSAILALLLCATLAVPAFAAEPLAAKPTASTVLVNGENTSFDAYGISDSNYLEL